MGNEARTRTQQTYDIMRGNHQRQRNAADQATNRNWQDYDKIMGGYEDWSKTGGYSNDDLSAIRSRATSPIRSIYSSARRELDRGQNLSGGYMPNKAAGEAKMAREMSYALSDKSTDANAQIAQMVHQGKQTGMEGMRSTYGTTPALSALHEGLYDSALNKELAANQQGNNLNMNIAQLQQGVGNQPGNGILGTIGNIANIAKPFMNLFPGGGGSPIPSTNQPNSTTQAPIVSGGGPSSALPPGGAGGNMFESPEYIDYLNQPIESTTSSQYLGPMAVGPDSVAYPVAPGLWYDSNSGIYYDSTGNAVDPSSLGYYGSPSSWSDVPPGYDIPTTGGST